MQSAREVPPIREGEHIEIETLAALAEGRADEALAAELAAHLAECRSCMAAYADAVRYRSAWVAEPQAFAPTSAMLRQGEDAFAAPAVRSRRALPGRLVPAVAIAALAAAVGFVAWRLQPAEPAALRAALERESSQGLVLPGGEGGADRETQVQRGPTRDAAIESMVARAARRYEGGDRSAATAYEVAAGYLVTGNLDASRDYVNEGLRAHPGDRPLSILAAVLEYRNSNLERAEQLLREVLQRSAGDAVATLDLAIVLEERGASDEARALLETLIALHSGAPLARRAERDLGAPDSRARRGGPSER